MPSTDPKREFAVEVVRRLQTAGHTALWAGGCVRDYLLGHPPDDYDVATSARPEEVRAVFGARRTRAVGASFGVMLVHGPRRAEDCDVEVATFRTEGPYRDGRRPEHVSFATAEEDALRRDFTINGMFFDPVADTILDYVGGRADLDRGVVRAIGDAHARFGEDKLRMLRAVRITARFDFELDEHTARAVREMSPEILIVSQERIAQELKKMLVHHRRARAMQLADELRVLTVILPELKTILGPDDAPPGPKWKTTLRMLEVLEAPCFELALAALLFEAVDELDAAAAEDVARELCRRLKLSNREVDHVAWLAGRRRSLHDAPTMPVARFRRLMAEPLVRDLIELHRAAAVAEKTSLAPVEFCEQYFRATQPDEIDPPPFVTGDDLVASGITPGPRIKELLDAVRDAQLEGRVSSRDEALRLLEELVRGDGAAGGAQRR